MSSSDSHRVERGRERVADADEDGVAGTERELAEDLFRLVREKELQRVVIGELACRGDDERDDGVSERRLVVRGRRPWPVMRSSSTATVRRTSAVFPSK